MIQSINQSIDRSIDQSLNQSLCQLVPHSVSESVSRWERLSLSRLVGQSVRRSVCHMVDYDLVSQSVRLSVIWWVGQSVSQSLTFFERFFPCRQCLLFSMQTLTTEQKDTRLHFKLLKNPCLDYQTRETGARPDQTRVSCGKKGY